MNSIFIFAIFAGCSIASAHAGLIESGEEGPYNKGIDAATNEAEEISIDELNERNAEQSDLTATADNIVAFLEFYVHLFRYTPELVGQLLVDTLKGLISGKNIPESLKMAFNAAVAGLQRGYTIDASQVLNGGKEANESPSAAAIIAAFDRAYEIAQEKRNATNAGRGELEIAINNLCSAIKFVTQLIIGSVVELPQFLKKIADGGIYGFSEGLKKGGLLKGITSALKYLSKGLDNGALTGFAHIGSDVLKF